MNQTMAQFYARSKRIKKVDINEGGVVNLIMRQPSQNMGSKASDCNSQEGMTPKVVRDTNQFGMFQGQALSGDIEMDDEAGSKH